MSDSKRGSGLGLSSVLGVAFVVLKLTDVIDWSWWWVLSPFWIDIGLALILLFVIHMFKKDPWK